MPEAHRAGGQQTPDEPAHRAKDSAPARPAAEVPARSSAADAPAQSPMDDTAARPPADEAAPDPLRQLVAHLERLEAHYDELLHRLLDQIEQRHALELELQAERFRAAELERAHDEQVRARAAAEQTLREIRHSRIWRTAQLYWRLTGRKG